ncbi:hypothetical protein ABRP55_17960, partial [Pectobacterium zantedeschiae]|uniref:hypothetical protein n=1 Tax=Pectobacterium zantedeschiae TaxID=2034769 RepID=UPI0032F03288
GGELVTIGNNKIGVGFSGGKYTFGQGTSSVYRRNGVKVSDDYTALPVSIDAEIKKIWTTKPTDTDDLKFFSSSAGWIRNTTDQLYGAACLQTTSSGYVDVVLANPRCLYKSIVKISFMAKGVGFLRAFSDVIGTTLPVAVSVSNAEWESFEILIPFDGLSSFFLRIGSDAGQSCLFDLLDIKTLRLDI